MTIPTIVIEFKPTQEQAIEIIKNNVTCDIEGVDVNIEKVSVLEKEIMFTVSSDWALNFSDNIQTTSVSYYRVEGVLRAYGSYFFKSPTTSQE